MRVPTINPERPPTVKRVNTSLSSNMCKCCGNSTIGLQMVNKTIIGGFSWVFAKPVPPTQRDLLQHGSVGTIDIAQCDISASGETVVDRDFGVEERKAVLRNVVIFPTQFCA
ncbi:MAG: hypothetical protein RLN89_07790 [Parvibaculum sp.]